jgi:hypothetical protein
VPLWPLGPEREVAHHFPLVVVVDEWWVMVVGWWSVVGDGNGVAPSLTHSPETRGRRE